MKKLNKNFNLLADDYLFAKVSAAVEKYKADFPQSDIISLGVGDATQPLVGKVIKACNDAAFEMSTDKFFRGYGPYDGYPFLKQAIVDYYKRRGVVIDIDDVFVTDGAKNGVGNLLDIFDSDVSVMIPDPVYPAYVDANVMAGHKIVYVEGNRGNGFLPMPSKKIKADLIYICSPNNPTGAAYTVDQLKEWVKFALDTDAIIIYDAAYEAFAEEKNIARSIYQVNGARDCAIEICSLSKIAGFTGVRCGWTVIPGGNLTNVNRMWYKRQSIKSNGTGYIVQRMAEAALKGGYDEVVKSLGVYKSNAKLITDKFKKLGMEFTGGVNSPYIWFYTGVDSWEFFDYLLKKAKIVCTPGSGFGKNCNGWIRITAFNTPARTAEAIKRFEMFWKDFIEVRGSIFKPLKK
ncbi:MAG: LL-diaminopimelate aminotransferase [Clostridiales bacterium]|nr:LL-diaminopimelate aminotransferase [Clostridiales bacterium]